MAAVDVAPLGDGHADDVPVVLAVALSGPARERLAAMAGDLGLLVYAPDWRTAQALVNRQADHDDGEHAADTPDPVIRAGDLEIDPAHYRALWRGNPLPLTHRERKILACLVSEPGHVWEHRRLHEAVWGELYLSSAPVHSAVKRLRRKLRQANVPLTIASVRGIGYQALGLEPTT